MKRLLFSTIFILVCANVFGQSPGYATITRSFILSTVLDITKTPNGTLYNFASIADHDNGIIKDFQIIVKANKPWNVSVSGATAFFNGGSASTPMPISVIGIKKSTDTSFGGTLPYMLNGSTGISTYTLNIKMAPGYSYEAGNYIVDLNFVVSAP